MTAAPTLRKRISRSDPRLGRGPSEPLEIPARLGRGEHLSLFVGPLRIVVAVAGSRRRIVHAGVQLPPHIAQRHAKLILGEKRPGRAGVLIDNPLQNDQRLGRELLQL